MEFWCLNVNRLKSQNQPAKIWFQIFSSQGHCSFKIYRTFSWSKTLNIIEKNLTHLCCKIFPAYESIDERIGQKGLKAFFNLGFGIITIAIVQKYGPSLCPRSIIQYHKTGCN